MKRALPWFARREWRAAAEFSVGGNVVGLSIGREAIGAYGALQAHHYEPGANNVACHALVGRP